jgi:hypothetical protein
MLTAHRGNNRARVFPSHASKLLHSRGRGGGPRALHLWAPQQGAGESSPLKRARGTARRLARHSLCARLVAKARRLSARRPASFAAPGRARRGLLSPAASSSRGVVVPPGGVPAPPERDGLLRHRPRAPARTPRAGATGSWPLRGFGHCGKNTYSMAELSPS